MFEENLHEFLNLRSTSIGTNIAYLYLAMLNVENFILSNNGSTFEVRRGYNVNLNIFTIFIGPPGTGKSLISK